MKFALSELPEKPEKPEKPERLEKLEKQEKPASEEMNRNVCWFVMRDLKRPNAKEPAYSLLDSAGFEVFTPMKEQLVVRGGKRVRKMVPVIGDLLFVHGERNAIANFISKHPTIQFRYHRGGYLKPMVVEDAEMERFIHAVSVSSKTKYFLSGELTPSMVGRDICVVGGPLDGYTGKLLSVRGSKTKRLLVDLPGLVCAGVEVSPEMIRLL